MKTFLHPDNTLSAAACKGEDTELFFRDQDIDLAKLVCSTCTVRDTCAADAVRRNEGFGVFGGLSANDRRHIRRAERERHLAQPGAMHPRMQKLRASHPHLFAAPANA